MTFVYFLGLLSVFLPIGLGAVFLTSFFSQYHNTVFLVGGLFLMILGSSLILGKSFSFSSPVHPKFKGSGFGSIFILGVFSAIATTCCAPVLAGALALSALPGSYLLGAVFALAYVLGMVAPLFIIATFLDKKDFTTKFFAFRKTIGYNFFGKKIGLTLANLFSGLMFLVLGLVIVILAGLGKIESHSDYQFLVNIYITKIIKSIEPAAGLLPETAWAIIFITVFLLIVVYAIKDWNRKEVSQLSSNQKTTVVITGMILVAVIIGLAINKPKPGPDRNNNSAAVDDHHKPVAVDSAVFDNLLGKSAPDFSLESYDGKTYKLSDLKDQNVLLFFNEGLMCYPACWNQIAAFGKDKDLQEKTLVLNITADSKDSWKQAVTKMPELSPAAVLFDTNRSVSNAYGVLKLESSMHRGQFPGHTYVLIDKQGIVRFIKDDVQMAVRNKELIAEVNKLGNR